MNNSSFPFLAAGLFAGFLFLGIKGKAQSQYRDVYDKNGNVIPGGRVPDPVYKPKETRPATKASDRYYESPEQKQARLKEEKEKSEQVRKESYGKYDYIGNESDGVREVILKEKSGYINRNDKVIVPIIYDRVKFTANGLYGVGLKSNWGYQWGFVDGNGTVVIPLKYFDIVSGFNSAGEATVIQKDGMKVTVDRLGRTHPVIDPEKEKNDFMASTAATKVAEEKVKIKVEEDRNLALLKKYDESKGFDEGRACVKLKGKWGMINDKGEIKIPIIYDNSFNCLGREIAVQLDKKFGYVFYDGSIFAPIIYDSAVTFYLGQGLVSLNGKWGTIGENGKVNIPLIYDHIDISEYYHRNMSRGAMEKLPSFVVKLNNKWGMLSADGHEVIPIKYDTTCDGSAMNQMPSNYDSFIAAYGKEIIPYMNDPLDPHDKIAYKYKENSELVWGFIYFKLKNKFYAFDYNGEKLVEKKKGDW